LVGVWVVFPAMHGPILSSAVHAVEVDMDFLVIAKDCLVFTDYVYIQGWCGILSVCLCVCL